MDATHQIATVGKVILGAAVIAAEKIREVFTGNGSPEVEQAERKATSRPKKRKMKRSPRKAAA